MDDVLASESQPARSQAKWASEVVSSKFHHDAQRDECRVDDGDKAR